MVNVWPCYQPDQDEPEIYEKYCYARMILHHPFVNDPQELLKHHVDWTAAYQSDCLDQVNPAHVHVDSLPTSCDDDGNEDVESDSEDGEQSGWKRLEGDLTSLLRWTLEI